MTISVGKIWGNGTRRYIHRDPGQWEEPFMCPQGVEDQGQEHVLLSPRAELPERVRLLCVAGQLAIFQMSKFILNRLEGMGKEHPVKKIPVPYSRTESEGSCPPPSLLVGVKHI